MRYKLKPVHLQHNDPLSVFFSTSESHLNGKKMGLRHDVKCSILITKYIFKCKMFSLNQHLSKMFIQQSAKIACNSMAVSKKFCKLFLEDNNQVT